MNENGETSIKIVPNDIKIAIETLYNSKIVNGLYIFGNTSLGKTYNVINSLKELNLMDKAIIINSHITPLSLFIELQRNHDKIILIDDVDDFNEISIGILKGALWEINGSREVCWLSSVNKIFELGLKDRFEFKGKIIITSNSTGSYKCFEPVLARMFCVEKDFDIKEINEIIVKLFTQNSLESEVETFKNKFIKPYINNFNIRNIIKWIEYTKNGHTLQADKVFTFDEKFKAINDKTTPEEFMVEFGCSLRTYQRYNKKYKELGKKYGI